MKMIVREDQMSDDRKTAFSVLIWACCIIAPPSLFLAFRIFRVVLPVDPWKYKSAGCVVFAWCAVIFWRTRIARQRGLCRLYERGFLISFIQHAFFFCLGFLALDCGLTLYACVFASMSYWMIAGVIVANRPMTPACYDAFVVTYGLPMLAFAVILIGWVVVSVRGF
jgi:hypothetical protein